MKSAYFFVLILMCSVLIGGCSDDSGGDGSRPGANTSDGPAAPAPLVPSVPAVAAIALTTDPPSSGTGTIATVSAGGDIAILATLTDSNGDKVANGTAVSFSVSDSALGSVSATATTVLGAAKGTFKANSIAGTVVVAVSAGGFSKAVSISIQGVEVGSIKFTLATPNVIGLKGSGQAETSLLSFSVKDVTGQNAIDGTSVTFKLSGPNGGEFITPLTGSTINGVVTTTLQSGTVAGPVRVLAETIVTAKVIASISTGVSIGGGIPSLSHFGLARSVVNLAGLTYANLESTVSVFLADRFGNFNVLEGTSVSFITEAGVIDRNNVTDADGITSVIFRTQNPPLPLIYASPPAIPDPFVLFTPSTTGNPVNGHAMIVAMTRGEECFGDNNGNGVFDGPTIDTFDATLTSVCDIGEPLLDFNDNGEHDPALREIFIDVNGNGLFDKTGNGVWDANALLWRSTRIAITGGQSQVVVSPPNILVPDGASQPYTVCVADENSNALMAGSSVNIALGTGSKGTLLGGGSFVMPDILIGPYCVGFRLADANPGDNGTASPVAPEGASIEITVTWTVPGHADLVTKRFISGTVD